MTILLATDLCRTILRQQPVALLSRLQGWSAAGEAVVVSAISYAELVAAALLTAERDRHMRLVAEFSARLDAIVPWDSSAVETYTTLQYQLLQEHRTLNMNDVMIAAHAISLQARLFSGSARSFAAIAGLDLQLWNAAEGGEGAG
jgi:tRNA(fMet)-specific endonuclease VapC